MSDYKDNFSIAPNVPIRKLVPKFPSSISGITAGSLFGFMRNDTDNRDDVCKKLHVL